MSDIVVKKSNELRAGWVCLNRNRRKISGPSAGCFPEMPIAGVTQGGRSPTGVRPAISGENHAATDCGMG